MNITKHNTACNRVFKRYDKDCIRCQELANGSKARSGWQKDYYKRKSIQAKQRTKAIQNHNCKTSNCGIVCTAFEW